MVLPLRAVPRAAGSSDEFERYSGKVNQRSQLIGNNITGSNRPSQTLPQLGVSGKTGKAQWVSRLIEGPGATRLVVRPGGGTSDWKSRPENKLEETEKKDSGNAERRRLRARVVCQTQRSAIHRVRTEGSGHW